MNGSIISVWPSWVAPDKLSHSDLWLLIQCLFTHFNLQIYQSKQPWSVTMKHILLCSYHIILHFYSLASVSELKDLNWTQMPSPILMDSKCKNKIKNVINLWKHLINSHSLPCQPRRPCLSFFSRKEIKVFEENRLNLNWFLLIQVVQVVSYDRLTTVIHSQNKQEQRMHANARFMWVEGVVRRNKLNWKWDRESVERNQPF